MATITGIGVSTKLDSFAAGKEAANEAYSQIGKTYPDIVLVFISTIFNNRTVIKGIRSIINEATLITGCSTASSITSLGSFKNSVTVCAIKSDSISFSCGIGTEVRKNPRLAGREAARQALDSRETTRQAYIILSDSLNVNSTDILRGSQEIMGTKFPIIGGSASDNLQFQRTYQYFNNTIYTDSIIGILISGNIKIGTGKAHGWHPIGKPHKITKSEFNIIKEIEDRNAIELYKEYMGKGLDELKLGGIAKLGLSYPLGIPLEEKEEYLIRIPLEILDDKNLMLSAEINEAEDINLMMGDKKSALEAAKKACREALENIEKSNIKFAIVFSDIGRLHLFKNEPQSETEIIKEILGEDIPFFGCYTLGEYAPINSAEDTGQSYSQSHIISVTVFSE
jgi:hypothetical protein